MAFPYFTPGAPAVDLTRMPSSDETTNNTTPPNTAAQQSRAHFPYLPHGYSFAQSHSLSPLQEHALSHGHDKGQSLPYNQCFDPAVSSDAIPDHPLTPPRLDDELLQLRRWYAQQQNEHGYSQAEAVYVPAVGYKGPAIIQSPTRPIIPPLPSYMINADSQYRHAVITPPRRQQCTPKSLGHLQHHHVPPHAHTTRNSSTQRFRTGSPNVHPQAQHLGVEGRKTRHASNYPNPLPLAGPYEATSRDLGFFQAPAIQQWPTHGLDHHARRPVKPPYPAAAPSPQRTSLGPSPGHDGVTPPDPKMLAKQEALRKRAEDFRRQRELHPKIISPPRRKSSASGTTKRKHAARASGAEAPTRPPFLRESHVTGHHLLESEPSYSDPFHLISALQSGRERGQFHSTDLECMHVDVSFPIFNSNSEAPPNPQPTDWDTLPQDITTSYEDYKWSVTHYLIDPNGAYDFAQSWLEDLFAINVRPPNYTWHAHSSYGFIKDGTRFSFVALHNASDPFERGMPSTSTTSIGVYGRHWHDHEEIHWKTFTPDIRSLLQWCENQNAISVKQKWTTDMPLASDKRFHRAYWLAATRGPVRGLLNHGVIDDMPHDVVEGDVDADFKVSEADLMREWEGGNVVTREEADDAWQRVLEENRNRGDLEGIWYEHVITGSSEWE